MLNAVGIDVSKGKSAVSVLQPGGAVVKKPFDVVHSANALHDLSGLIRSLEGDTRAVMECTGRYRIPILPTLHGDGIFVSAVNPHLIQNFGNNTIRKVKSDPADSKKIARYALDSWASLRQYPDMDTTRTQLKALNSQMDFFTKQKVAARTNLIALPDMTYPGVNSLFSSPAREDGSEKWPDYAESFWHVDCVRKIGLKAFTERYQRFCKRHGYNFQPAKPERLYQAARELIPVYPKDKVYKDLIMTSIGQLKITAEHVEHIRHEMDQPASTLPEYETVLSMRGVGKTLGPQLMAEIGDIMNYTHREALTAFAGVDPGVNESGSFRSKSNPHQSVGLRGCGKRCF